MAKAPEIEVKIKAVLSYESDETFIPNQDYRYLLDRKEPVDPDFHTHPEYFDVNHVLLAHWHVRGSEEHKHGQVVSYGYPIFTTPEY